MLPLATTLVLLAAPPVEVVGEAAPEADARNWVNFRIGGSAAASGVGTTPAVCFEVTPVEMVGVEACGNGAGFLHTENVPEIAQFKAKVRGPALKREELWIEPWVGVGFAEMQIAEDTLGFHFGGTGPLGVETAGPLVTAAARGLMPVGQGFELVGEASVGGAFLPAAPQLATPQSPFQLLLSISLGIGF